MLWELVTILLHLPQLFDKWHTSEQHTELLSLIMRCLKNIGQILFPISKSLLVWTFLFWYSGWHGESSRMKYQLVNMRKQKILEKLRKSFPFLLWRSVKCNQSNVESTWENNSNKFDSQQHLTGTGHIFISFISNSG